MARSFNKKPVVEQRVGAPGPATDARFKPAPNVDNQTTQKEFTARSEVFEDITKRENLNRVNTATENLDKRVDQHRRDTQDQAPVDISLYDIDSAVDYFINNVVKPTVVQNGETIQVPMIYGSPERWSSQSKYGYYRDNKGKLMLPLIMYRRTGLTKNEQLLFPRTDKLGHITEKKWDKTTRYDKFTALTRDKRVPPSGYTFVSIPNYMIISYEFVIWTAFLEQMNPIIERINFTDYTYWGDPQRFKFRTQIENFTNTTELNADNERLVRTEFATSMYGYLLPKDADSKTTTRISIAPKKVVFEEILANEIVFPEVVAPRAQFRYDASDFITFPFDLDYNLASVPDEDLQTM